VEEKSSFLGGWEASVLFMAVMIGVVGSKLKKFCNTKKFNK